MEAAKSGGPAAEAAEHPTGGQRLLDLVEAEPAVVETLDPDRLGDRHVHRRGPVGRQGTQSSMTGTRGDSSMSGCRTTRPRVITRTTNAFRSGRSPSSLDSYSTP